MDGVVLEGLSSVDEAMLTGESLPQPKQADDKVYAATINQQGMLRCRALAVGSHTQLAAISLSISVLPELNAMLAFSVAMLTTASTSGIWLRAFSRRAAQEAQCMPVICSSACCLGADMAFLGSIATPQR